MPRQDKTGPLGQGALTGRGLGPCGAGLGFRCGFGRGLGFRARAFSAQSITLTQADEKKILQAELKELEAEKSEVEKRLKSLKSK